MDELDARRRKFGVDMLCCVLGRIDAAMLATGAAERNLHVLEAALEEAGYMVIDQSIDRVEKLENLAVLLQEVDDGLVEAGELLVFVVLAGVVGGAAVEHVAAAVAGVVLRYAFLKTETINRDC